MFIFENWGAHFYLTYMTFKQFSGDRSIRKLKVNGDLLKFL